MSPKCTLHCIGYASGIAAADPSCCMGPLILQAALAGQNTHALTFEWRDMLYIPQSEPGLAALSSIVDINLRLAKAICEYAAQGDPFLVLGGDHTSAIGTWSGAAHALSSRGQLGLIWIDAHMDSHTSQTSITHNLHEMPLAALLGQGIPELVQLMYPEPKLQPKHVCLIGVREFAPAEAELLKRLGVRIFLMEEVKQRGLAVVVQDALQIVTQNTIGYGISLDIRALDPADAPGTSTAVLDGIPGQAFCEVLKQLHNDVRLLGLEITEFNPRFDQDLKTEKLIQQIVEEVFAA